VNANEQKPGFSQKPGFFFRPVADPGNHRNRVFPENPVSSAWWQTQGKLGSAKTRPLLLALPCVNS
jgi:hypothetical protein